MKKSVKILLVTCFLLFQSCYFGAGMVEQNITDKYWLFANNTMDEMSIWYFPKNGSNLIVKETVFAVGYNDNFIIAKNHPKDLAGKINKSVTHYHIININKDFENNPRSSTPLTFKQFEYKREQLNIPEKLDFTIVFEELK